MSLAPRIRCWIAHPALALAYLGACRRVTHRQKDVERARRHFGPGSMQEDRALDELEAAMERRHQAGLRLHSRSRSRSPGMCETGY